MTDIQPTAELRKIQGGTVPLGAQIASWLCRKLIATDSEKSTWGGGSSGGGGAGGSW